MLHLQFSNRFERLLDTLLTGLATPPASPFVREEIVVPSLGVQRRVELSAADRFGICANVRFSFLAEWLWRQIGQVIDVSPVSPFKTPVLTWRVFRILDDEKFVREHPPLVAYLRSGDPMMRYELASRVAALFEQYITYRPDWLQSWSDRKPVRIAGADAKRQQDERWQAAMWRRIADDIGTARQHPSVAFFEAIRAEASGTAGSAGATLPPVAHVFCLPAMPPLYLDILQGLGRWIDLHLYVLNPSREYWFDIVEPRRLSYLKVTDRADHHEVGHPLLASWGKQTQAHIELLLEKTSEAIVDDAFVPAGAPTLLAGLQDAILDLAQIPPAGTRTSDSARREGHTEPDRSIEIHVCHSLTRELEVLHDQLLAVLAAPNPPRPSDILVVTPNLRDAAPLIDAVFGTAPRARYIPFAITGRPSSTQNAAARALLAVLAVARSRFPASSVFEVLQQPIVARRFDVGAAGLDTIHRWIAQSGIRWGIDGRQRAGLSLPDIDRHTFADGLDRLFMGYALPSRVAEPLNGRLPSGNAEGSESLALGSFQRFVDRLEQLRDVLAQPRNPVEWRQVLIDVADAFLSAEGDEVDDLREVTERIRELHGNMSQGGAEATVPAEVLLAALRAALDESTRGGVPTGSVTFASMSSLRTLPYRCIFVVGMNDGAFPSTSRPDEFDLMALSPRRGDRQRRLDERNLFLDIILAARERLYISYTGRSVRDNSPLPPSVLVSELLDHVATSTATAPVSPKTINEAREKLLVVHPLQPFSATYFDPENEERARSFNDEYRHALAERFGAAHQQMALPIDPPPADAAAIEEFTPDADYEDIVVEDQHRFFRQPLDEPGPEFRDVTLAQLDRFFRNPCAYLLRKRMGLDFDEPDGELVDDEPFVPGWSERNLLAARLLPRLLEDDAAAPEGIAIAEYARAGIEYPPGRLGEIELERELQLLSEFAARVRADRNEPALAPLSETIEFLIGGEAWRLTGAFSDLRPRGLVRHHYDDVRMTEYLSGWLEHLFLSAVAPADVSATLRWHSRDGHYTLSPCSDARERLAELVTLYRDGLMRPLHFFPKSAWKLVTTSNFREAYNAWRTSPFKPFGEDRHAAYRLALRGVTEPLDAEFEKTAAIVFGPVITHIEDLRLS